MEKLGRKLDTSLDFDSEYVHYVEEIDLLKLQDTLVFEKVKACTPVSDKIDKTIKTDLLAFEGNFKWKGFQLKNDSYPENPDYTFHLRREEIYALLVGNHGASSQLHIGLSNKKYEEIGLCSPEDLDIVFLAEVDLSALAKVIGSFEFVQDNDLLKYLLPKGYHRVYDPDNIEPGEYKIRYYNHHKPEASNRYVVYRDWETGETHYIFKWIFNNENKSPFIRIPYAPLLTAEYSKPIILSKIIIGSIPEIEFIKTTK